MRTATAQQTTDLESVHRQELVRVRVADHNDTLQDFTVAGGAEFDWFQSGSIVRSKNARTARATLQFQREMITARYGATVVASTDTFTALSHGLANGDLVYVVPPGVDDTLPAPLDAETLYWVVGVSGNTFQVATSAGGAAIDVTADATVSVLKLTSLAPKMHANPPLENARRILVDVAVIAQDATVTASDWIPILEGRIDRVAWGDHPSRAVVYCRDKLWKVMDQWVETPTVYGSDSSPVAQETVMQTILDDWTSTSEYTLVTPVSPNFGIVEYTNRREKIGEALDRHANWKGWDWRLVHNGTDWELRYSEPPRTKTTPDYTFTRDLYFRVRSIEEGDEDVRNVGYWAWDPDQSVEVVEDTASIADYDVRRPMFFDSTQDAQLNTLARAQAVLSAAVSDTARPPVPQEVEGPLDWRFELDDLIRWPANGTHYSTAQDTALFELEHLLDSDPETGSRTIYRGRTKPSGGNQRWLKLNLLRERKDQVEDIVPDLGVDTIIPTVEEKVTPSGGSITLTLVPNDPGGHINGVGFQPEAGPHEFDFDSDPTTWEQWDATAVTLSDSVTLVAGHGSRIGYAVRYNTGDGNRWIRSVVEFDAGDEADVRSLTLGFTDAGQLLLSGKADEDTVGILVAPALDGSPATIGTGASNTTTNAESAGATSITMDATTGFAANSWYHITDGQNAEIFLADSGGGNLTNVGPSGGLQNSYGAGATVTLLTPTAPNGLTGIRGRTGKHSPSGGGAGDLDFQADIGALVTADARGINRAGELGPVHGPVERRRGDSDKVQPKVHVTGTKSSGDASITFDVTDPTLAVSSIAYKRRDQDNQTEDGTWQTAWTSSTGTVGVDKTLSRTITVADPYGGLLWRIEWTDENGTTQEIGDEIDLASIQELSKTVTFEPTEWQPENSSTSWSYPDQSLTPLVIQNGDTGSADNVYYLGITMPPGVTLTNVSCTLFENNGSASASFELWKAQTSLASFAPPGTPSATLNEPVEAADQFMAELNLNGGGAVDGAEAGRVGISYTMPSYKQTY